MLTGLPVLPFAIQLSRCMPFFGASFRLASAAFKCQGNGPLSRHFRSNLGQAEKVLAASGASTTLASPPPPSQAPFPGVKTNPYRYPYVQPGEGVTPKPRTATPHPPKHPTAPDVPSPSPSTERGATAGVRCSRSSPKPAPSVRKIALPLKTKLAKFHRLNNRFGLFPSVLVS
jgi:hypothetical protein